MAYPIIVSYQVSRISDLGGDIKNVNARVDQIYPLIAQSTSDLGFIKGSLEATAQKFTMAAEKNDNLAKRLDALVASQEAQSNNIQELSQSISSLVGSIKDQQNDLEDIKRKISFDSRKEGFLLQYATCLNRHADAPRTKNIGI